MIDLEATPPKNMSKTILVVDDDRSVSSIFEFILQSAGYKVVSAFSGKECLDIVATHPNIDLVFMDIRMPVMSGIETFRTLLETRPDLLVIIMTGYAVNDTLKEAFDLGAYGVIYKPFDVEEVLDMIRRIFKTPGASMKPSTV